jgi:hypothetical protein
VRRRFSQICTRKTPMSHRTILAGSRSLSQFTTLCYWSLLRVTTSPQLVNSCPNTSEHNALLKQNQHSFFFYHLIYFTICPAGHSVNFSNKYIRTQCLPKAESTCPKFRLLGFMEPSPSLSVFAQFHNYLFLILHRSSAVSHFRSDVQL